MSILFVDCCISQRGEDSRTARLCKAFGETFKRSHPEIEMERLDLTTLQLEPYTVSMLNERDRLARAGHFEAPAYALARQFQNAEGILVGAPFWDASFPAQLRIYIEHISANGLTYYYDDQGPHGTCKAKWLVYLTTGGAYETPESLGVLHWKQLCSLFGIERYASVFAGGLDAAQQTAEQSLQKACEEVKQLAFRMGALLKN